MEPSETEVLNQNRLFSTPVLQNKSFIYVNMLFVLIKAPESLQD